jgi:hypothetical protein
MREMIFEQQNTREFYLELGVLTKNVTVMLFIVLAEAALTVFHRFQLSF